MISKSERYKRAIGKLQKQKDELLDLKETLENIIQMLVNRDASGNMLEGEKKYLEEETIRLNKCKQDIEKCNEKIESSKKKLGKYLLKLDKKSTK